ncbi:MAG: Eco47II family restriction endonuclease [Thiohalomonadaceae bacterium]
MSKALDYIKTLTIPTGELFEDLLAGVISDGLGGLSESQRKTVQNHVGKLMEIMTAEALGFTHLDIEGADIVSHDRKVIAEIKNRYNTLNHGGRQRIIRVMKDLTLSDEFRGYDKYLVIVHPRTPGYQRNIGQAITEITAAKFFKRFDGDFRASYMALLEEVSAWFGVTVPEITEYYDKVVFAERKSRRKKKSS